MQTCRIKNLKELEKIADLLLPDPVWQEVLAERMCSPRHLFEGFQQQVPLWTFCGESFAFRSLSPTRLPIVQGSCLRSWALVWLSSFLCQGSCNILFGETNEPIFMYGLQAYYKFMQEFYRSHWTSTASWMAARSSYYKRCNDNEYHCWVLFCTFQWHTGLSALPLTPRLLLLGNAGSHVSWEYTQAPKDR